MNEKFTKDALDLTWDRGEDEDEKLLPCGHSVRQARLLGCTEEECRPGDMKLSADYWFGKGRDLYAEQGVKTHDEE